MKKSWWVVIAIILSLAVTSDFIGSKFPYTHDGENHLARMANYKIALKEGQYPPRFAPNLFNHYGYPVLNYNYPLANILSLPFSLLKLNYEFAFKVLIILSVSAASIFLPMVAEKIKGQKLSNFQKIIISATYLSTPYLTNALIFRGSIGEVMATSLAILILYFQINYFEKRSRLRLLLATLAWAFFFLSHNVLVMILTPLLLLLLTNFHQIKSIKQAIRNWAPFIYGVSLSLWFWLPAWFERNETVVSSAGNQSDFYKHFVYFYQLLEQRFSFGFSQIGSIDTLSFSIGLITPFVIALVILNMFKTKLKATYSVLLLSTLAAIFMQLDIANFIYQYIPVLKFIQFPWRFSSLLLISLPLLLSMVSNDLNRAGKVIISLIILSQLTVLIKLKPVDFFHKNIVDYDAFSQSTSTQNENLPTSFTYLALDDWKPSPSVIEGNGEVNVIEWNGSYRNYYVTAQDDVLITEPTMEFLGWQTFVRLENSEDFELIRYVDSEIISGRIAYELDQGSYEVKTRFTQRTPARVIGNGIFLVSISCFGYTLIKKDSELI